MTNFVQPVVVLSRCLEMEPCRWNNEVIRSQVVKDLEPFVHYITPCPEVEIGLGVPRSPVRLAWVDEELRMVQPASGRDVTEELSRYGETFLDSLEAVDGFILKSRSASCGIKDVKYYINATAKGMVKNKGPGLFGGDVAARFPDAAVEDEGRLLNFTLREHFFTKLFTLARCRVLEAEGSMGELVKFQAQNKYLLMAYGQEQQRSLGRIVANREKLPFLQVMAAYRRGLAAALTKPAKFTAHINVLMHCFGYISQELEKAEREFFLQSLDEYRRGRIPLSVLLHLLRGYALRFDQDYLLQQTYFQPYPQELVAISDSGKGRDR